MLSKERKDQDVLIKEFKALQERVDGNYFLDNVIQVSDYDFAMDVMKSNSGFTDYKDTAQSSWLATFSFSDKGSGNIIHIYRPYATSYTFYTGQRTGLSGGNLRGYKANGVYKNQTSTTGLKIIFDSNVTFGKFSVYGVI